MPFYKLTIFAASFDTARNMERNYIFIVRLYVSDAVDLFTIQKNLMDVRYFRGSISWEKES